MYILNTACKLDYVSILKLFSNNPIDISKCKENRLLHTAILNNNFNSLSFLLNNEELPYKMDKFSFIMACEKGNVNIIKLLANDERVDITMSKNFGIRSLIGKDHLIAADYLFTFDKIQKSLKKDDFDSYNFLFQRYLEKNIHHF